MIMKIIAVIMVYNCGEVLPDTLKSIDGLVDEIRCFDGRYSYIKSKSLYSTDDTREIVEKFALLSKSKTTYNQLPFSMFESEARTFSIRGIKEGDWVFVIDSDERVVKWDETIRKSKEPSRSIFMDDKLYPVCRLYRKISDMKYYGGDKISSPLVNFHDAKFKSIGIYCIHEFKKRTRQAPASTFAQGPHP